MATEKPVVTLDAWTQDMLATLARLRAQRLGGQPSQSAVIRELVKEASERVGRAS